MPSPRLVQSSSSPAGSVEKSKAGSSSRSMSPGSFVVRSNISASGATLGSRRMSACLPSAVIGRPLR